LLDEIYSSMTCEPIPLPPGQYTRARPPKGNALARPVEAIATTDGSSRDARPVVISPTCAMPIACMNGYDLALAFFFDRGGVINESYKGRLRAAGYRRFRDLKPLIQIPYLQGLRHCRALKPLIEQAYSSDDEGKCTPLYLSSYYGHASCVEWLLQHGVYSQLDISRVLLAAAEEGRDEVIEVLLRHWGNFKKAGALSCAAGGGHVSTVKMLMAAGLDVNEEAGRPLFMAVENNHLPVVQLLLDSGADRTFHHVSNFYNAVGAGDAAMVRLLLPSGVDLSRALEYAARCGHVDVAEILIEAGADQQRLGDLVLGEAICGPSADMVALLLSRGADPRTVSNICFKMAASCGRVRSIALVLDAGMPLDAVAPLILQYAARAGHTAVIDLMEQRGADPVMVADWRLLVAATTGDDMKVQALLEAGVSADALEEALFAALQCSHEGIVSRLFRHQGTGDTLLSEARKTILARACSCDSSFIIQRLVNHFCTHHPLLTSSSLSRKLPKFPDLVAIDIEFPI